MNIHFEKAISIIPATIADYPVIQNMARFYVYDLSRECGSISSDWDMPKDGLYESFDFKNYFEEPSRKAYLVKVYDEIAGFVLLNQETENPTNLWNMGEFFIIAKFQGQGIASYVAAKIWEMHQGTWEVSVIPENKSAHVFWEKTISKFTGGVYHQSIKDVTYDEHQPKRIIFEFDTGKIRQQPEHKITIRPSTLADIGSIVELSKAKRLAYEKAQPSFWKYRGEDGDNIQKKWFEELLAHKDHLMLTSEDEHAHILGFIIGKLMPAPEVYDPGGLTLMIDDFCVSLEDLWTTVGAKLIEHIRPLAKDKGAAQILVVCGAHDQPKRTFLMKQNLSIASEWFVGNLHHKGAAIDGNKE